VDKSSIGSRFPMIDPSGLRLTSGKNRPSKVHLDMMGKPVGVGDTISEFLDALPDILKAKEFKELVGWIKTAKDNGKPIIWMMGGHVIKCGLGPVLIDLMDHGFVTGVAMHGAGMIHDVELALIGHTSEDVEVRLKDGSFGMTRETAEFLNSVAAEYRETEKGLGEAVGEALEDAQAPNRKVSIIHAAIQRNLPSTVHVSLGTDVVHMHPNMDGAAVGKLTMTDFRIFAYQVSRIGGDSSDLSLRNQPSAAQGSNLLNLEGTKNDTSLRATRSNLESPPRYPGGNKRGGGVVLNLGSAVIMPEVFLKALSMVRNLEHTVEDFTTANFDQIQHYRPHKNVIERPGGRGYWFTGHHEIMIPLLAAGLK
jgi:hypothetical protein